MVQFSANLEEILETAMSLQKMLTFGNFSLNHDCGKSFNR
jgi:hypothetical protein